MNDQPAPLIASGTLTPGISAEDFGLPLGTALRCERPDASVRPYVSAYFVMDSKQSYQRPGQEIALPNCAIIWAVFAENAIKVSIGRRHYSSLPTMCMFGATSRAMPITARGGVSVALEIGPLGWARLIRKSAEEVRDRIVPLDQVFSVDFVNGLSEAIAASGLQDGLKPALDEFLGHHLKTSHRDEDDLLSLMHALADGTISSASDACVGYCLNPRKAARIARQYMGFPIKTLQMRVRFLRALVEIVDSGGITELPTSYHDWPHLLRDSRRYLGMTPRQYLSQKSVYTNAVRRARRLVIGAPLSVLDAPPEIAAGGVRGRPSLRRKLRGVSSLRWR